MMDDKLDLQAVPTVLSTLFVGRDLRYFDVATSTNELAKDLARAGVPEGTTVVADYQSAGRGRMGRSWLSAPGASLLVSVVLRPSMEDLNVLIMAAALSMVRSIERATGLTASIKWPNDVEVGGKKVCGILIETEIERGSLHYAVLGAGLNVSFDTAEHPAIAATATSLAKESARAIERAPLLRIYLESLEEYYLAARQGVAVWQEWKQRLETLGKWVRLISGDAVTEGWAEDVDATGMLYIRRANGEIAKALAGEVTLRVAKPPSA